MLIGKPAATAARTQEETPMLNLVRSCLFAGLALLLTQPARAATTIELWHAMSGALNDRVDELADKFNKSQSEYVLKPVLKGGYDDVVTA